MEKLELLTVKVGGLNCAIPLDLVQSVSESAAVTPLPYSPPYLRGLIAVADRILPLIDLADVLGLQKPTGGPVVIVALGDDIRALEVDQVVSMITIEMDAVSATPEDERHHPFLGRRFTHSGQDWLILDYVRFARETDIEPVGVVDGASLLPLDGEAAEPAAPQEEAEIETGSAFLLVSIEGDRYGIATAAILEIMTPGSLRHMPSAPTWVAGLLDRRGVPVLAVSPAVLLGRRAAHTPDATVALLVEAAGGLPYAIMVNRALGIERISKDVIYALDGNMAGVSEYTVLNESDIVGILSPSDLASQVHGTILQLTPSPSADVHKQERERPVASPRRKLLTMRLGENIYGLDLNRVDGLLAAARLSPLPGGGAGFDGLTDIGDRSAPVKDLRRVFDESPIIAAPPCILLQLEGAVAGIAVDQVLRIEDVEESAIERVADRQELPVSEVAFAGGRSVAILTIDRLLPPVEA